MPVNDEDRSTLNNIGRSTWEAVACQIERTGICTEFDVSFLSKDLIRRAERSVKLRLRRHGYAGGQIAYLEVNVSGANGYAFYSTDRLSRQQAEQRLREQIACSIGLPDE